MDVYHVVSWLGWTGNLLVAELVIYFAFTKHKGSTLNEPAPVSAASVV
jgi:hypothetical protein